MEKNKQHLKNKLGLLGWLGGGRYGMERYAYALHRLTGLGLLTYFILHIFVTGTRIAGPQAWQQTMQSFSTPWFKFGEFLIFVCFAYHGLNGLRLGITELGLMLGKPARPIYPYRSSVLRQRPFFVVVMILVAAMIVIGGTDFYLLNR
ncbi:MAG TPA: succinate dehydrogenase [bacterium]|nr:succinate dehydrogenase [bacterium]